MSAIYDNWEKLVDAVLKKEQLWQLFHSDSISISSDSSGFSFCNLTASLDDPPLAFPKSLLIILDAEPPNPARKRDLKIEVPKFRFEDVSFSSNSDCYRKVCPRTASRRVKWRGGGIHSKSEMKQQSYPLPLPPGAVSKSTAAKSPSASLPSPEKAENVKSTWKKGKSIGRGPFGNVYLGFDSEKGEMCAVKEASLSSDADMKRMLEKNIALLSRMKHPNIVQYFGSETVGDNFYIYLEYVSGGSIHTILQEYGKLGELAIRNYSQQIVAGLAYLHSKNIVHGNIKAPSILMDPNGTVKLSNFVIEKHVVMDSNVRKSASDIWSLGCTILEMATKPCLSQYKGVRAMFKVSCQNELPAIPDNFSDVCKDFLKCCLQSNPLRRATASQLLEHPFVKSSSPLGKQLLASPSSGHPAATNAVKSEGSSDCGRSPRMLDSGKAVLGSSKALNSSFQSSDVYTPRYISAPVSPVGPASPQLVKQQMSPPKSSPSMAMVGGIGSVQPRPLNRTMWLQEGNSSPKLSATSSPSYWDPNILQAVFRFS